MTFHTITMHDVPIICHTAVLASLKRGSFTHASYKPVIVSTDPGVPPLLRHGRLGEQTTDGRAAAVVVQ